MAGLSNELSPEDIETLRQAKLAQRQLRKYTVKDGDTLFSLARSCSITVDELRRLNNMSEKDVLLSGSRINLPE